MVSDAILKRNIKDSVFTNLFKSKKYLLQLFQVLHPEETDITEDELDLITINPVITDSIYNDLGFIAGDRVVILAEAQSTWSPNIVIRSLMYLAKTYQEYIDKHNMNSMLYKQQKMDLPKPELYVIYTGEGHKDTKKLLFSEEFMNGEHSAIEITVNVITDSREGDILWQYFAFTHVCYDAVEKYGRSHKAAEYVVEHCIDANILREYMNECRQEVVDIMGELFDNEKIMRSYIEYEIKEAREKAISEGMARGIEQGREQGLEQGFEQGREQGLEQGREQGLEQGLEKGIEQGLEQGREQGRAEGVQEGRNKGIFETRLSIIKSLMSNTGKCATDIMTMLNIPESEQMQLISAIN